MTTTMFDGIRFLATWFGGADTGPGRRANGFMPGPNMEQYISQ